jgi:hypothetical protein
MNQEITIRNWKEALMKHIDPVWSVNEYKRVAGFIESLLASENICPEHGSHPDNEECPVCQYNTAISQN